MASREVSQQHRNVFLAQQAAAAQGANPYLQNNFAAFAQVQMMMQGGHLPAFYAQCGSPQLAAFKALYVFLFFLSFFLNSRLLAHVLTHCFFFVTFLLGMRETPEVLRRLRIR